VTSGAEEVMGTLAGRQKMVYNIAHGLDCV